MAVAARLLRAHDAPGACAARTRRRAAREESEMDLSLTSRGDYAVRAALCLARAWPSEQPLKIRQIAAEMDLPASYAPQVLKLLAVADLAEARAGPEGGYRLQAPPEEITLLAVVEIGR